MPEEAIKDYWKLLKSKKELYFTGFTATSLEKQIALKFAHGATQRQNQVPVLFVMDVKYNKFCNTAMYLHDKTLCAYPKEKEYLIGYEGWIVTKITK